MEEFRSPLPGLPTLQLESMTVIPSPKLASNSSRLTRSEIQDLLASSSAEMNDEDEITDPLFIFPEMDS